MGCQCEKKPLKAQRTTYAEALECETADSSVCLERVMESDRKGARKVGSGQIIKSLLLLRNLDSFYPEGSREFQRNLKQECSEFCKLQREL